MEARYCGMLSASSMHSSSHLHQINCALYHQEWEWWHFLSKEGGTGVIGYELYLPAAFFLMYKEFVSRSALITMVPGSLKLLEVIGSVRLSRGHFIYVSMRKPSSMLGEDFPVWLFGSPPFSCKKALPHSLNKSPLNSYLGCTVWRLMRGNLISVFSGKEFLQRVVSTTYNLQRYLFTANYTISPGTE